MTANSCQLGSAVGAVEFIEEDICLFYRVIEMNKNIINSQSNMVEELKADFEPGVDL